MGHVSVSRARFLNASEARAEEVGRLARETEGTVIVEIRRGHRRFGCWSDPMLRIEPGDRVIAIDANGGR